MQWVFLVIGLLAALIELHAITFYLAAVSAAALVTAFLGTWIPAGRLVFVFVGLCIALLPGAVLLRRQLSRTSALPDPDVGQIVTVVEVEPEARRLTVSYRGSRWEAVMEGGVLPAPGQVAVIAAKTDKLLHLTLPAPANAPGT